MPSNAAFHPTIETVGFQTAFSVIVKMYKLSPEQKLIQRLSIIRVFSCRIDGLYKEKEETKEDPDFKGI
jgi:hypothetical protein